MSPRGGRRLSGAAAAHVEAFTWSTTTVGVADPVVSASDVWPVFPRAEAQAPSPQEPAPVDHVDEHPVEAAEPEPFQPTAEQQAQLAALERDAFTKGYAQGERAGLEAGGKRAEAMLRRLAQTLEDVNRLHDTMVRRTERELVQLAFAIARRILHREVRMDAELVAALAHIAVERLGTTSPATVRLHPDDYSFVTAGEGGPFSGRQVDVRPDPAVARGGCIVESEFGFIDASVDAQLDEIARAVLGDVPDDADVHRGVA